MKKIIAIVFAVSAMAVATATAAPPEHVEFFEKKIRPVLAEHCYGCHNSHGKKQGDLALDYKTPLLAGGESGEVIVAGDPKESILILALRHEDGYEMPSKSPKLPESVIADFERWVKLGAPDPRLTKPTAAEVNAKLPWEQVRELRKEWWSFQPLLDHPVPQVDNRQWTSNPIDRFVYDRLQREGLAPQTQAAPEVLVRRLHLILTGLPPQPAVVASFVADPSEHAYRRLVDTLLDSKAFGERWARHWMDWYRYAESHGSEGDPRIPYAQRYRDYLIRALNADVPYDQLLREHLAGDLMDNPRINSKLGINESTIGPAHLRLVPHGFGVTDAYGEQIAFTDNQVDVISKAMLGVTVSCARCHDHKFDPISQKDYYRFYGMMVSCRPSNVLIDAPGKLNTNKSQITAIKKEIRTAFAQLWLSQVEDLPAWLEQNAERIQKQNRQTLPLGAWVLLRDAKPESFPQRIAGFLAETRKLKEANRKSIAAAEFYVDLREGKRGTDWYASGNGTAAEVSPAGSFALRSDGKQAMRAIYPRGIYTHLISDKHAGVFSSKNFYIRGKGTQVRVAGFEAQLRAPIRNYPLNHGLHPAAVLKNEQLQWVGTQGKWKYWQGEKLHYELSTDRDKLPRPGNNDRSWFGITEIFAGDRPPQPEGAPLVAMVEDPNAIRDRASLGEAYVDTLRRLLASWRDGVSTDAEAEFLNAFVQQGFLANQLDQLPKPLREKILQYRKLESEIPVPVRAPGVLDADPVDHPLLVRGNHKMETDRVKRQFLEIFSDRPYGDANSGRLALAEDVVSQTNTLKTRVLINRLWGYVFGRGIAASTDNLGRLGSEPSHPELLDHLALDFERHGWSIKHGLRQMVTSRTFRSGSQATRKTRERDSQNVYLSYFTPRRLDAEAIYDSIGYIGGRTDRAVYLPVLRNKLNPFLNTFNAPVPTTTVSFRTHTNVPAQSLSMMNGDIVERAARSWSEQVARNRNLSSPTDKIATMYQQAFARSPSTDEMRLLLSFMEGNGDIETQIEELTSVRRLAQQRLTAAQKVRDALLAPTRERLQAEVDLRNKARLGKSPRPIDLKPMARWDFEGDTRDSVGQMHGELMGDAQVEGGALSLNGGCLLTAPIKKSLQAKTLEVLVQLSRVDQRGGGAMTVQTRNGHDFDSVVFAEMGPATWLAGSNNFRRTLALEGAREQDAVKQPVRLVIAYDANGTIRAYRNGKLYGKPYRKAELLSFQSDQAQVVFGLRHGTSPTNGRMLRGRIYEARLYDRALTAEEVAAISDGAQTEVVTLAMLNAALPETLKLELKTHESKIGVLEKAAGDVTRQWDELQNRRRRQGQGYFGIAHALLNSKEFVYVY
jgi:hypothetical protein